MIYEHLEGSDDPRGSTVRNIASGALAISPSEPEPS